MTIHNGKPVVFRVHLDNGTLIGSFYETTNAYTSVEAPIISQYGEDDSKFFAYYKYQSGYIAFEFNFESGSLINSYRSDGGASNVNSISQIFGSGFVLFSMSTGAADMTIFKFYYHDVHVRRAILDVSSSFSTGSGYQYTQLSSFSSFSTYSGDTTMVDGFNNAWYISSYNEVGRTINDLIYLEGYNQVFYALHNSTSIVDYTYFCSQSGSTTIGGVVYHPETNQASTWVSMTGDNQHLTVNAPAISTETEEIQLGLYYITNLINTVDSKPRLILYQCNIANCETCSNTNGTIL